MAQGLLDDQQQQKSGSADFEELDALRRHQAGEIISPEHAADLKQQYSLPSEEPVYSSTGSEPSDDKGQKLKTDEKTPTAKDLKKAETKPAANTASNESEDKAGAIEPENIVGSGYKEVKPQKGWLGKKGVNTKNPYRRYLIFGGIGAGVIALIFVVLSFLNIFKLDGLMSNIEQRAFLRHNASLNSRSSKYISAYIEARMMQFGNNPTDNPLFRSDRVDTNRPFTDWYRTMVTSNFEKDVFEKHGVKFTSYFDDNGRPRLGKIDISVAGTKDSINLKIPDKDLESIANGDLKVLSRYQDYFNVDRFDSNKAGRQAIKKVVNENTHWLQVYKRRFLRRSIQNMTGVRDWRFFENTRDKITDKKIDIRNRIIDKMVPDDRLLGQVTRCLFGLEKCSSSRDPADSKTQASITELESGPPDPEKPLDPKIDSGGQPLSPGDLSEALQRVFRAANIAFQLINIPNTLNMISSANKAVSNLVKTVVLVRGVEAAGMFQVFETSRDQIKTGQVSGDEVNAFMQNINTAASSAGWSQVISGSSKSPAGTTSTGGNCSREHQAQIQKDPEKYHDEYAPLCANQQIGSASNAQQIQEAYKSTIGQIIGPIADAWNGLKSNPITGTFISIVSWVANIINSIIGNIIGGILNILGIQGDINKALAWIFGKMADFLGLSIYNGWETSGAIFNWLVQGGAYSAESSSRQEGAALTTPASQAAAQLEISQYQTEQRNQASLYDKVASLDNPDSLAFKGATALSNVKANPGTALMSGLASMWSTASKNFGSIFSGRLLAATPSGYAASQFAGIETYDYPQQCYDLDPITQNPIDGTNALSFFSQKGLKVSAEHEAALNDWATERSSSAFYKVIYEILEKDNNISDNADDYAVQIYNCNLLDTAVRGSLGYLYGYTADADSQVIDGGSNATTGSGSTNASGNIYGSSVNAACDPRTRDLGTQKGYRNGAPVDIQVCALPNLPSSGDESTPGSQYYIQGANGQTIVNSVYSKNFYDLVEAAKASGITMYANSGFRTMAHQLALCQANAACAGGNYTFVAQPGTSNHQMGLAIDFATPSYAQITVGDTWYNWLSANASKFTISNYPDEAWHWSADGK